MPPTARLLADLVSIQAATRAQAPALIWQQQTTSYQQLQQQIEHFANRCAYCFSPAARIGVLAWNCPQFVQMLYAIPAAGQLLVPLNTRLSSTELSAQIADAGISALFGHAQLLASLPPLPGVSIISFEHDLPRWLAQRTTLRQPALDANQPAWILFTSGTSGRPKGAVLTHRSLLAGLRSAAYGRPVLPGDRYLYPFPLFHVAAHNVLLQHQHGATVVLLPAFKASEVLQVCQRQQITTLSLAPTMLSMLLDHPDFTPAALNSVRSIGYGASAISEPLLSAVQRQTKAQLSQSYGMTELSGSVAFLDAHAHRLAATTSPQLRKSAGKPVPGVTVKLLEQPGDDSGSGEILVRAAQVMQGYWQQPNASAATLVDGWLHTGDIGRFDEDGYLYIVDRKKAMIITGGENVASREVEAVLEQHPCVSAVAVVGVPDRHWGERVSALIVPAADKKVSAAQLSTYCRRHLAGYKTPRVFAIATALPLNAAGKVDKNRVRERLIGAQQNHQLL